MKKMRVFAIATAAVMIISTAGCGSTSAATTADTSAEKNVEAASAGTTEAAVEEFVDTSSRNPVAQYAGAYSCGGDEGYSLLIEATDDVDGVYITIGHLHGEDYTYWEMTGTIKDNVVTYSDGARYDQSVDDTGEDVEENLVYSDGTGSFEISPDSKITWTDDKENVGEGLEFTWDEELNNSIQQMYEDTYFPDSVSNWAGAYADLKNTARTMYIYVEGNSNTSCAIIVNEENSATEQTNWTMSGVYDADNLTITYSDCSKKTVTLDESGNVISENTVYEGGTGSFVIDEENQTIAWNDDKEDAGAGSEFGYVIDEEFSEDAGATSEFAIEEEFFDEEETFDEEEDYDEEELSDEEELYIEDAEE